jgi:glycosyltransferase involved in cell wall biosynthesis
MLASVIIPTYNNSGNLSKTLDTILQQSVDLNEIEVLICDDGSSDDTEAVCDKYSMKLNISYLFQADKGFRAGAARNMGIRKAVSDLCIFIDTGTLLSTRNIENHIKAHTLSNNAKLAVIGYVYGFDNNSIYDELIYQLIDLNDIDSTIAKLASANVIDMREPIYRELGDDLSRWPAAWVVCWTANLSVPRKALLDVGGFDEWYHSWGGEDTDLALALHSHGVSMALVRECVCIEYPNPKLNLLDVNPELAECEFEMKRDYMNKKYNLTSIKVWYEKRYNELNQELLRREKEKLSIIWDVTRQCAWNCSICCASAIYNPSRKQLNSSCDPNFAFTGELNLSQKKRIIDSLVPGKHRVDFSGGEVLIDAANLELIEYAARRLGKDSISLSTSGAYITDNILGILSNSINDVELTLDYSPLVKYKLRPSGYHEYALYAIKRFQEYGIPVGV